MTSQAAVEHWYKNKIALIAFGTGGILLIIGIGTYFLLHTQSTLSSNPAQAQEQIIERVGALMELPQGELPTVATVSDVSKLQSQSFFQHAKNGDEVVIYKQAKEAILYDPVSNKIVQVSSVNIAQATPPPPAISPQPVKVVLLNGTRVNGLTKTVETELKMKAPNVTVVSRANAAKSTYTATLVVDLSSSHKAEAAQLAAVLSGTVGSLPSGESKPAAVDIVVILGKSDVIAKP